MSKLKSTTYCLFLWPCFVTFDTQRAGRTWCHIPLGVQSAEGKTELYSDTKMLGVLKCIKQKNTPLSPSEPKNPGRGWCNWLQLAQFFKQSQEVNSSCLCSWSEAKQTGISGWDSWLVKGALANHNRTLNSKFPVQFSSTLFLCHLLKPLTSLPLKSDLFSSLRRVPAM